jgi:predicted ArsR family transcriptional regulator
VIRHQTLADEIGVCKSTVKVHINKLKKLGLVRVRHRYSSSGDRLASEYEILPFDEAHVRRQLGLPPRLKLVGNGDSSDAD